MRSPIKSVSRKGRDAEAELNLPPGFRFHPTDEELVVHYLCRMAAANHHHQAAAAGGAPPPPPIIAEIDLYKHDPWELPEMALFGTKEWYFFTPRDRKYPNGSRPNRAAGSGYWKATGADKPIRPKATPTETVGIKKALVFYVGKAPKGIKTNWIMHEYRLAQPNRKIRPNNDISGATTSRLDDWVLCRLYNKKNNTEEKIILEDNHHHQSPSEEQHRGSPSNNSFNSFEETDVEINYTPVTPTLDQIHNHDHGDKNELKFMMSCFTAEPMTEIHDLSMSRNGTNYSSLKMEEDDDENGNDWFTSLSLEDLQHSLAAMPAVVPLPSDQFSTIYQMPIMCHTNQLPFHF